MEWGRAAMWTDGAIKWWWRHRQLSPHSPPPPAAAFHNSPDTIDIRQPFRVQTQVNTSIKHMYIYIFIYQYKHQWSIIVVGRRLKFGGEKHLTGENPSKSTHPRISIHDELLLEAKIKMNFPEITFGSRALHNVSATAAWNRLPD